MASCAAEVHETTSSKDYDSMTIRENKAIDLVLNWRYRDTRVGFEASHIDFIVEVSNISNNRIVLHLSHVASHNNPEVSSGCDKDISSLDD